VATVILTARDSKGRDAPARVWMDDELLTGQPSGESVTIDPGPHTFRFVLASGQEQVQHVTIAEGARQGRVTATFDTPAARSEAPLSPSAGEAGRAPAPGRTVAIAMAGTGIAAVAAGVVFGLLAVSSSNAQKSECPASNCTRYAEALGDYKTATRDATISTIALGVGGGLLLSAGVLWLLAPRPALDRRAWSNVAVSF
jgi:hypothetical protein